MTVHRRIFFMNALVWSACILLTCGCESQKEEEPGALPPSVQGGQTSSKVAGGGGERVSALPTDAGSDTEGLNQPPEVESVVFVPASPVRGKDLRAEVLVRDAEGDETWIQCKWFINGEEYFWARENVLPGDSFRRGDRIVLEVIPRDFRGEGPASRFEELEVENSPPVFITVPTQGFQGWEYVYDAQAEDADGDPIVYSLEQAPGGVTVDPAGGQVRWKIGPENAGKQTIKLQATDPQGAASFQEIVLNLVFREEQGNR